MENTINVIPISSEDSIEIIKTVESFDNISKQLAKTYLSALRDRQQMEATKQQTQTV